MKRVVFFCLVMGVCGGLVRRGAKVEEIGLLVVGGAIALAHRGKYRARYRRKPALAQRQSLAVPV